LRRLSFRVRMTAMLIPQFSIRWLLGVTTACAVVFSIVALGVRGSAWATAVSVGIGSMVILGLVYALAFGVVWAFSVATVPLSRARVRSGGSPFRSPSGGSPFALQSGAEGESETRQEVPAAPILVDESPVVPEGP
jgi:predicted outer membrane lipoprotein